VPDVPYRFGQPLLRYTEFVSPILNFMRLEEADAASVLRPFVCKIVGHNVLSDLTFNALVGGRVPDQTERAGVPLNIRFPLLCVRPDAFGRRE
jgi:hypothetical protein